MDERRVGWQEDGTYVACPACGCEPKPHDGPGVPVHLPGTLHHRTCTTVPDLTPSAELLAQLAEIRACERRAWAWAQTAVIG